MQTLRWGWRLIFSSSLVGWMGLIFHLSASPPAELPRQLLEEVAWLGRFRDIVGHLTLYAVLGPLLLSTIWSWRASTSYLLSNALVAVCLGVAYGVLDEYHQSFVPGRSASALDVLVDSVGVVASVACLQSVTKVASRRLRNFHVQ